MSDERLQLRCPSCRTLNRVPASRVAQRPRCGRCRTPIMPEQPVPSGDRSFTEDVLASPIPTLVDFWAPWCGPCRSIAPALDQIARERAGRVKIVKVNVDENPQCAARFAVRSIPALKLFRGGTLVDEILGAATAGTIEAFLARNGA